MAPRHSDELLFDSEASLRLVDRAITELRIPEAADTADDQIGDRPRLHEKEVSLMDLPNVLLRAYVEINSVLQNLRHSRDVLQQTTLDKLQHTNDKLREVSSATELAATDMLDGLDRALVMVDELEGVDGTNSDHAAEVRGNLRNELFSLMTCLQFQDITAQQLNYASSVLVEMEHRLTELARIFDPDRHGFQQLVVAADEPPQTTFDPAATTADAEQRQALVDEIFTGR
jgi:chemotaxis regulatin CheY-phosphate phosphatase CheZ